MTFTTSPNSELAFWNQPAVPLVAPPMSGDVIVNSLTATTFVTSSTVVSASNMTCGAILQTATLTCLGAATFGTTINVTGFVTLNGGIGVTVGASSFQAVSVAGALTTAAGITNTGAINTTTLVATGAISGLSAVITNTITAASLTLTGLMTANTLQINSTSLLTGAITASASLTVGTTLAVTGASTFTGLVTMGGHLAYTGSAPGIAQAGGWTGTALTSLSVTGNDQGGVIAFTTGGTVNAAQNIVTITFAVAFATAPKSVLINNGTAIASFPVYVQGLNTTGFTLTESTGSSLSTAQAYTIPYTVT